MIQLSRQIRFFMDPKNTGNPITNSWAGWPQSNRLVPFLQLTCTIQGEPDPVTGYVCNIKVLDDLLRKIVVETLIPNYAPEQTAEQILRRSFDEARRHWQDATTIESVVLETSPFLNFSIQSSEPDMTCVTQQFEFSASHRLHCPELPEVENQKLFGKCNNPNGHGHNYVVEISVTREMSDHDESVLDTGQFESTVKELVIEKLDHKHLNTDVEYFHTVIPSVENISIAIWNWLDGQIKDARLSRVRVYETPKTWADYSGT